MKSYLDERHGDSVSDGVSVRFRQNSLGSRTGARKKGLEGEGARWGGGTPEGILPETTQATYLRMSLLERSCFRCLDRSFFSSASLW